MEPKSIMPNGAWWRNERFAGSHRHEVFFGPNRQKSIDYGLFVFLSPAMHNMSNDGVHKNRNRDLQLKRIGQQACMAKHNMTEEDFIREFGKSFL